VTFSKKLIFCGELVATCPTSSGKTTLCRLPATAFSTYTRHAVVTRDLLNMVAKSDE
jgi:hypothetical protein